MNPQDKTVPLKKRSHSESFNMAIKNMSTFVFYQKNEYLINLRGRLWITILVNCVLMNVFTAGIIEMKDTWSSAFIRTVICLHAVAVVLQIASLIRMWGKEMTIENVQKTLTMNAAILMLCFLVATPIVDLTLDEQSQFGCLAMILALMANLLNIFSASRKHIWFVTFIYFFWVCVESDPDQNNWPFIKVWSALVMVVIFVLIGDIFGKRKDEELTNIHKAGISVIFVSMALYVSHQMWDYNGTKNPVILTITHVICNRFLFKHTNGIFFMLLSVGLFAYQCYVMDEFLEKRWMQLWFSLPVCNTLLGILMKMPKGFDFSADIQEIKQVKNGQNPKNIDVNGITNDVQV